MGRFSDSRDSPDAFDPDDDDAPIVLGAPEADPSRNLGPDEHDIDLLDGSWEERYYRGEQRVRNWNAIMLGLAILVVAGLVVSMAGVWLR